MQRGRSTTRSRRQVRETSETHGEDIVESDGVGRVRAGGRRFPAGLCANGPALTRLFESGEVVRESALWSPDLAVCELNASLRRHFRSSNVVAGRRLFAHADLVVAGVMSAGVAAIVAVRTDSGYQRFTSHFGLQTSYLLVQLDEGIEISVCLFGLSSQPLFPHPIVDRAIHRPIHRPVCRFIQTVLVDDVLCGLQCRRLQLGHVMTPEVEVLHRRPTSAPLQCVARRLGRRLGEVEQHTQLGHTPNVLLCFGAFALCQLDCAPVSHHLRPSELGCASSRSLSGDGPET
mmetsp:Transcript_76097/g.178534  ORF Transcript_76097/g.178534 Transcript_76097/m.178534 type:complete len:289 (-) Transcript_76097:960-1826(-)